MTPDEMQGTFDFILRSQANTEVRLDRLAADVDGLTSNVRTLTSNVRTLAGATGDLVEISRGPLAAQKELEEWNRLTRARLDRLEGRDSG